MITVKSVPAPLAHVFTKEMINLGEFVAADPNICIHCLTKSIVLKNRTVKFMGRDSELAVDIVLCDNCKRTWFEPDVWEGVVTNNPSPNQGWSYRHRFERISEIGCNAGFIFTNKTDREMKDDRQFEFDEMDMTIIVQRKEIRRLKRELSKLKKQIGE